MRIGLVDLKDPRHVVVDKTIAGGMGTATSYGQGVFNQVLTSVKAKAIKLLPYNVAYVSAILKNQGHILSYHTEEHTPDYDLAVLFTSIPSHNIDIRFLKSLKGSNTPAIVVGTLAGVSPERYQDANLIIRGEPEAFFYPTWNLEDITNCQSEVRDVGQVKNLDDLPMADWTIFPSLESRYAIVNTLGTVLPLVTSRGCPYSCSYYCPYPLGEGKKMRFRTADKVIEEMRYIRDKLGVLSVKFRDPIFTVNRKRTMALLQSIKEADLGMTWGCETHLNVLDEDLLEAMADAGCRLIQTGIESTQGEVIQASKRKNAKEDQQRTMLEVCQRVGIKTAIYFIVGLPEDTPEGMKKSLDYARNMPSTYIQITVCTPYPGTQFYGDIEEKLTTHDWEKLDQYTPVLASDNYSPEQLIQIMSWGYRRFYMRPQWLKNYAAVVVHGLQRSLNARHA